MRILPIAMCAALLSGTPANLRAAESIAPLRFEHLTVDDGLPENSVRTIVQDAKGFLWFGTHSGLARYDGKHMVDRWHSAGDSASAPRFMILSLTEDRAGHIWVGTAQHGLWWMDPQREQLQPLSCTERPESRWVDGETAVQALASVPDGTVWVGWGGGSLCRHDELGNCLGRVPRTVGQDESLVAAQITALHQDTQGNLWIGTSDTGLALRSVGSSRFRVFRHDDSNPTSLANDLVNAIFEAQNGQIWISTLQGLSAYRPAEQSFRNYAPDISQTGEMGRYLLQMSSADDGGLWIGSALGLYHFDPLSGRFQLYSHDSDDPNSPVKGPVLSVLRDRSGIVWGGSWHAGLNKLDPNRNKFKNERHDPLRPGSLDEDEILAILQDRQGALWVGTGAASTGITRGGLNRRLPGQTNFAHLEFPREADRSLSSVRGLAEDQRGDLWVATDIGLFRFDAKSGRIVRPSLRSDGKPARITDPIRGMCLDHDSNLWVCGTGTGLYRIDLESSAVFRYKYEQGDPHSLSEDRVNFAFCDSDGRVWIGSDTKGLNLYRAESDDFLRYFDLDQGIVSPTDMLQDRGGRLWVASWEGLLQFDPQRGVLDAFASDRGLPHDLVASVLEDHRGQLWLSTGRGLVRLDPTSGATRIFDVRDGLPSNRECFGRAAMRDGRMYFGGHDGLISFLPGEIRDSEFQPNVVLTELHIGDALQLPSRGALAKSLPYMESLSLAHDQNDVSFRFAALDFAHPDRNLFRYRLVGFDDQWREAQNRGTATYTNLQPEHYRFEVQASNSDAVWTGASTALSLTIQPPWWQTVWARALYALGALALVYFVYAQLLQRERMRAALRLERAQAQQLLELDQFKSRFFANISHEFRTPLTLLQVPLQRLREDPAGGDRILFSMMLRNADRLRELIDQLLDLARLEAGKLPLRWQNGDWLGFLRALIASFHSMAAARGVLLNYELPSTVEPAWHDPDVLEKIVGNLLSNAFRFTPDHGEVRIRATVEQRDGFAPVPTVNRPATDLVVDRAPASWLVIEVFNSGSYIPPADRTRIFDRFEQTGANRTGHSGVGLALVKELVQWMHGNVGVESVEGVGTTFSTAIPLYHVAPVLGLEPSEASVSEGTVTEQAEVPKVEEAGAEELPLILIVEDNFDLRSYLRTELSAEYRVLEANDGESGLAEAFEELPDLVLSDVMMPGIDGLELTRRIKEDERTSHIPVILLTARVEIESRREGLQTGADDYLSKPFDAKELRIRVANLIEQRRKLAARLAQRVVHLTPDTMPVHSADERFLARACSVIESHLDDPALDVETLCREIGLSRAQLHRKLKALTGQSTREFLRSQRLRRAAKLLEGGFGNVTEVAFAVGFSSSSYFAQCFREEFGLSPTEHVARGRKAAEGEA